MDAAPISAWLEDVIWPQIRMMMLSDALHKLFGRACQLTDMFNGTFGGIIQAGYVTSQTVAIRRLCDDRSDVISLRRVLIEAKDQNLASADQIDELRSKLDCCDLIRHLVNKHIAHTSNPTRDGTPRAWDLRVEHLTEAQKAICQVAIILGRDVLEGRNDDNVIPVPQFDILQEFRPWVPSDKINELQEFWDAHVEEVDGWVESAPVIFRAARH